MMQFLRNSQDPVIAEKWGFVGSRSCSPTIRYFKNVLSLFSFQTTEDAEGNPPKEAYSLQRNHVQP